MVLIGTTGVSCC
jgi:hypothetical protein